MRKPRLLIILLTTATVLLAATSTTTAPKPRIWTEKQGRTIVTEFVSSESFCKTGWPSDAPQLPGANNRGAQAARVSPRNEAHFVAVGAFFFAAWVAAKSFANCCAFGKAAMMRGVIKSDIFCASSGCFSTMACPAGEA